MKIKLTSVFVDDQAKALAFYTEVLGFIKKTDIPVGEYRWLTVVSAEEPRGVELVLEPNGHPAAATYQKAIREAGIPATAFAVDDLQSEYERLKGLGVRFAAAPAPVGEAGPLVAKFDDMCGNLIQLFQG